MKYNTLNYLIEELTKKSIPFDEFLERIEKCTDTFFLDPYLEFELLISNGLPLEIENEQVSLSTLTNKIEDQVFCIVDIETNGSNVKKGYQIIELGAVKVQNGKVIDQFDTLVYAKDIPPYIQDVTNIRPSMLKNAPFIKNVLQDFKIFLEDTVFIAHDIKFDFNFISDSFEKYDLGKLQNRKLCSIDLAKRTIDAQKYGLKFLKEELDIKVKHHHRAYYDALTTYYIFIESLSKLDVNIKTTEDLIAFSKQGKIINPPPKRDHNKRDYKKEKKEKKEEKTQDENK